MVPGRIQISNTSAMPTYQRTGPVKEVLPNATQDSVVSAPTILLSVWPTQPHFQLSSSSSRCSHLHCSTLITGSNFVNNTAVAQHTAMPDPQQQHNGGNVIFAGMEVPFQLSI